MKRIGLVFVTVLLLQLGAISVDGLSSQEILGEQWEASGASALYEALPEETQGLLERLGIDGLTLESFVRLQPQSALSTLRDLLSESSSLPCSAALTMLSVLLLLGFFSTLHSGGNERNAVFRVVCMLAATVPLLAPLWQTVSRVGEAAQSASVFSLSFAPVYAATLLSQGFSASALSYQTAMVAAAEGVGALISEVTVPLGAVTMALGVAGALDGERRLGDIGGMVGKTNVWLLTLCMTVFVALLSFQSVLSASADTVGGRMLRFSVAGFIPIVGGSLSEALYTVQGCLSALRGTVGGFGVLCGVMIILPALLECTVWDLLLFLVKTVAELFGFSSVAAVAGAAKTVMKTLIAALASSALLMVISVTLVTLTAGGSV